jgi:hypothetical protein
MEKWMKRAIGCTRKFEGAQFWGKFLRDKIIASKYRKPNEIAGRKKEVQRCVAQYAAQYIQYISPHLHTQIVSMPSKTS